MMKKRSYNYGQHAELTGREALGWLESAVSEGVLFPEGRPPFEAEQLFGRQPAFFATEDISSLTGLAASGLRTAAYLNGSKGLGNYPQLIDWARQHLAAVVHLAVSSPEGNTNNGHDAYHALTGSGCFQLFSSSVEEALDFAILAHRIAELSLVPGIHALDEAAYTPQTIELPARTLLQQFLGDPDEHLSSPTPAQEMIFGKHRRRVPNWFNVDLPTLNDIGKGRRALTDEVAARRAFFYHHLPSVIDQVLEEYRALTGKAYQPVAAYQAEQADYMIVTQGSAYQKAKTVVDRLRREEKAKVGALHIHLWRPFPLDTLAGLLSGKKGVTLLEPLGRQAGVTGPLGLEMQTVWPLLGKRPPERYHGSYGAGCSEEMITAVFRNMMRNGDKKKNYYLGVEFTRSTSAFPRHEILLQTVKREYPELEGLALATPGREEDQRESTAFPAAVPLAIRRFKDQGAPYSQLSRFYHHTAGFYQSGGEQELVADPFQAIPAVPAATAGLLDTSAQGTQTPRFLPENCTGCGQCLVYCPHMALPSMVIGQEQLLRGAMDMATTAGTPVTQLTPLVKNLARLGAQVIKGAGEPPQTVGTFLPSAFEKLLAQLKPAAEKEEDLRAGFEVMLGMIKDFPVAVTDTFFQQQERREKGTGELFTIAIDPHACTGCGLCAAVCEPDALVMEEATPEMTGNQLRTFRQWEQLPDTSSETISRQLHDETYDPFAALALSRNFYESMTGGSPAESGAPAKVIVHQITTLAESIVQPRINAQVKKIDEYIQALSGKIRTHLSDALPADDFSALLPTLQTAHGHKLPLDELVGELGAREHLKLVDTALLQRWVALVDDLRHLRWLLTEGPAGSGRARMGLVIQAGVWPWADQFPRNPFLAPAIVTDKDFSVSMVEGLVQGQLRHGLDNIRLLRRAQLEAKGQYRPEKDARTLAGLGWPDLTDDEKGILPPLLLVSDQRLLAGSGLAQLSAMLSTDWPAKVLILDTGQVAPQDDPAAYFAQANTALLSVMNLRTAYCWQGAWSDPRRTFTGLRDGLHRLGPALFRLLTPDHEQHQLNGPDWTGLNELGTVSRAFPTVSFDPDQQSELLSGLLSLEANPSADEPWHAVELEYSEGEETKVMTYRRTYADWLYSLQRWSDHFQAWSEEMGNAVPVAEYLSLNHTEREGKQPVILATDPDGALRRMAVSEDAIQATRAALRQWMTWREVAGTLTPFPEKLRAQVEAELTEKYEASMADLRSEYEEKLRQQEDELMAKVKVKLRERLLALSKR